MENFEMRMELVGEVYYMVLKDLTWESEHWFLAVDSPIKKD